MRNKFDGNENIMEYVYYLCLVLCSVVFCKTLAVHSLSCPLRHRKDEPRQCVKSEVGQDLGFISPSLLNTLEQSLNVNHR